jgi:hypothetical protein
MYASFCNAGIDWCPIGAAVGRKENTANSTSKEIRAGDGESVDLGVCQSGIDCGPISTAIGGNEDAAISPGKEIRARDGKAGN